jgi:perosamine synthetase
MAWPPTRDPRIRQAVVNVLDRGVLVGGPEVEALEHEFAAAMGVDFAVAVSSGTAAITAGLLAAGIGPGDKVIVPALTFSGSALPIVHIGARPIFLDVDPITYCINPDLAAELAIYLGAKAIIVVHLHGYPVTVSFDVRERLRKEGILILEDACQAAGARLPDGVGRLGGQGLVSAFSLNERKQVFAGEGGIVMTDSAAVADHVRRLRRYGEPAQQPRSLWRSYESVEVGFNWKLAEIPAAIARVSLQDLGPHIERATKNAILLTNSLRKTSLVPPEYPPGMHAWHKYRVRCPQGERDAAIALLHAAGVPSSLWQTKILPDMPAFRSYAATSGSDFQVARNIVANTIVIGDEVHPLGSLEEEEIGVWAKRLVEIFG